MHGCTDAQMHESAEARKHQSRSTGAREHGSMGAQEHGSTWITGAHGEAREHGTSIDMEAPKQGSKKEQD